MQKRNLSSRHVIDIAELSKETITHLLDKAEHFLTTCVDTNTILENLRGYVVTNLFFEPSTRTRHSFEIAAARLSATCINSYVEKSSLVKGETLLDTVHALEMMGTHIFIIRHSDNHIAQFVSTKLLTNAHVINAGDGKNQHPSQALLDLLTVRQHKKDFSDLTVTIVGDILHSRVATSFIQALTIMGTKTIRLVAPPELLPQEIPYGNHVTVEHQLTNGLKDADVIMALRIQKERLDETERLDIEKFIKTFSITQEVLMHAKPDAIVMHPGPMNRGIEIDSAVADGPQSVIWKQVRNGIGVRMAILDSLR